MFLLKKSDRVDSRENDLRVAKLLDDILPFLVVIEQDQIRDIEDSDELGGDEVHAGIPTAI